MNWYYFGLIGFLVLWEIVYLFQRKFNNSFDKTFIGAVDNSWFSLKIAALVNTLIFICLGAMVVCIVFLLKDVLIEVLVTLCAIGIFFGINYLLRGEDKKGRKK
jgi:hypothetical protein